MGGGCDGPLGMAKEANDDALVAIWRRGNLVREGVPCKHPRRRSQDRGKEEDAAALGTSNTDPAPVLRAKPARPFVFIEEL